MGVSTRDKKIIPSVKILLFVIKMCRCFGVVVVKLHIFPNLYNIKRSPCHGIILSWYLVHERFC